MFERYGTGAPMRCGEGLLRNPQMEVWCENGSKYAQLYESQWELFLSEVGNKIGKELAMPCIYNNVPALRGGLKPKGFEYADYDSEYVFSIRGMYLLAKLDDVRPPTQREFDRHFRELFSSAPPFIVRRKKKVGKKNSDFIKVKFYKGKEK